MKRLSEIPVSRGDRVWAEVRVAGEVQHFRALVEDVLIDRGLVHVEITFPDGAMADRYTLPLGQIFVIN